jgi:glutathione S-transferase
MLTIHHLRRSQSERIVWLCEELGIDYALKSYDREATTLLAPPDYKALHPMGTAPVIDDGAIRLAESGAIVEYLMAKHGGGRLALPPTHADYAAYVHWLHFPNGTLLPVMGRNLLLQRLALLADNAIQRSTRARLELALNFAEAHLAARTWLAGDTFTAADIMTVFSLTTMRLFYPLDLAPWPNIRAYLARIGARDAYRRAMAKGDPGMEPMLG